MTFEPIYTYLKTNSKTIYITSAYIILNVQFKPKHFLGSTPLTSKLLIHQEKNNFMIEKKLKNI